MSDVVQEESTIDWVAVVVYFPKPDNPLMIPGVVSMLKDDFKDIPNVKYSLAHGGSADEILDIAIPKEASPLVEHAKNELDRIESDEDFKKSILRAIRGFVSYGHSGGSASVAIPMINELLQFKNLSPLTNNPLEWMLLDEELAGPNCWQSKRNPEAFSNDGGETYYLLSEWVDEHKPIHETEKID